MECELHLVSSLGWNCVSRTLRQLVPYFSVDKACPSNSHVVHLGQSIAGVERERLAQLEELGASTYQIPRRHQWDPFARRAVRKLAKQVQPEVVVAWDYAALDIAPLKEVVMLSSCEPIHELNTGKARKASKLLVQSSFDHQYLREQGFPEESMQLQLQNVYDHLLDQEERETVLAEYDLPTDKRLIGVFSPLWPEENIQELIWAADLLRVLNNDVAMVVVGDGPHLEVLQHFAATATEIDPIRFLPDHLNAERLVPHLEQLWHAGTETSLPYSIAVAIAAGIPVVADDTPGARQVITHGETGLLVPRGDRAARGKAAQQLWTDPALRTKIVANAGGITREQLLVPS